MRYETLKHLKEEAFKRLVGIPPELFTQLVTLLEQAEGRKLKSGCPTKLSLADQLLLTQGNRLNQVID
ncbi:hypothetical protein [Thiofilum flexile]|uniref:hypothetical protein n=1 Tax=Thiofilum flexile TaxID=125627 RepID=UPI000380EF37|nr:hypothetical protein [Thiofilum flexile]